MDMATGSSPDALAARNLTSAVLATAASSASASIYNLDPTYVIANATSTTESDEWVLIVDVVILSLTIIGALGILVSMFWFEFRGRAVTTRMRIVQSLVVSDLMLGIIGLIGSAMALAGHSLVDDSNSCDGLGFSLVATLFSQHFWTLSLAFATFMILIHPLHNLTSLLEKYWYYLWVLVWVISVAIALVGYLVYGYYPTGGICFYGSNAGLYGELIQFIPRGIVFVLIAFIYGRLFVFLRRPDKIHTTFSDTSPTGSFGRGASFLTRQHGRVRGLFSRGGTRSAPAPMPVMKMEATPSNETDLAASLDHPQAHGQVGAQEKEASRDKVREKEEYNLTPMSLPNPRKWSRQSQKERDIPPWERVELPVFQVDGQRFGGAQANTTSFGSGGNGGNVWDNWKGFGVQGKKRPSTTSSTLSGGRPGSAGSAISDASPPMPFGGLKRAFSGYQPHLSSVRSTPDREFAAPPLSPTMTESAVMGNVAAVEVGASPEFSGSSPATASSRHARRRSGELSGSVSSSPRTHDSDGTGSVPTRTPALVGGVGIVTPSAPSTPAAETPHFEASFDPEIRRNSARSTGSTNPSFASTTKPLAAKSPILGSGDIERTAGAATAEEEDDDDEPEVWDLMKVLKSTEPPESNNDRFAVHSGSDQFEYVPESMASYLNRKTALLMLWFPLGYILLFSVSLIRIIYDFDGNPPASLRAISRWMIFAQGALDALIYGLVEWHTKRVVRKRARKGTFSPRGSGNGGGSGLGSAIRGLTSYGRGEGGRRTTNHGSSTPNGGGVTSQVGQTVSFAEPVEHDPRSIHQQLVDGRHRASIAPTIASSLAMGRKDSLTVPPR